MPYVTTTIEVDACHFDDDDIIEEAVNRRLVNRIVEAAKGRRFASNDERQVAEEAYAALMGRRLPTAATKLADIIHLLVPPDLLEAYEAAKDGRRDDAICRLDAYLSVPSEPLRRRA